MSKHELRALAILSDLLVEWPLYQCEVQQSSAGCIREVEHSMLRIMHHGRMIGLKGSFFFILFYNACTNANTHTHTHTNAESALQ